MAICETCDYANRPPYKSPCSECDKTTGSPFCCYEHEEKPTNADRIRAMSDDELCEMLTAGTGGFDCGTCRDNNECDRECELHCAEWLKQPAE